MDESGRETAELLSRLIQIDTTNPPGNETAVAHFLRDHFAAHGVEGEVVGEWPRGRTSSLACVARDPARRW